MYKLVLLLLTLASQMIVGSPIYFPDEVKMDEDGKGFMVLPGVYFHQPDNKSVPAMVSFGVTRADDQLSLVMNISAKVEPLENTEESNPKPFVVERHNENAQNGDNITDEIGSENLVNSEESNTKPFVMEKHNENVQSGENNTEEIGSENLVSTEEKNSKYVMMELPNTNLHHSDNITGEIGSEKSEYDISNNYSVLPLEPQVSYNVANNNKTEDIEVEIRSMNMKIDTKMDKLKNKYLVQIKSIGKSMNLKSDTPSPSPSEASGKIILFGDEISTLANNTFMFPTTKSPIDNDSIEKSEKNINSPILNPCPEGDILFKGNCAQLLSSYDCQEDQWLVMKGPDFAECVLRPCPFGQILYQDECVSPDNSTICSKGQMLYVEMTGEAYCDCDPDYIYLLRDGTCVPEYEQGSCDWGQYLVRNEHGIPECVTNPCGRDGSVFHEENKMCYNKNYVGFCEQEQLEIKGNQAECKEIFQILALRNVFEVPTLRRCPRGSLRDLLHECRRRYNMPSMPSVLKAKHFHGGCPPGWMKASRGRCKKIVDLFSSPK